jgi:hypothetical protein
MSPQIRAPATITIHKERFGAWAIVMRPVSRFWKNQRKNRCITPQARIIVGLSASNPFDLVPGNGKGSHDRLGLPHCEEGINPAPARIIALNNGTSVSFGPLIAVSCQAPF